MPTTTTPLPSSSPPDDDDASNPLPKPIYNCNEECYRLDGYNVETSYDEDKGRWLAELPELRGCLAYGDTPDEAYDDLRKAKRIWMESRRRFKLNVPDPTDDEE